jgi:hypothetical protein
MLMIDQYQLVAVLNAFVAFALSQPRVDFSMDLGFFIVPMGARSRLFKFLANSDPWFRTTANEIEVYLKSLWRGISLTDRQETFERVTGAKCDSLWTAPLSPFQALHRFFTFYCDCATFVARVPIWRVTVAMGGQEKPFETAMIEGIKFKSTGGETLTVMHRNLQGNVIQTKGPTEFDLAHFRQGEARFRDIEDEVLVLDFRDSAIMRKLLVTQIECIREAATTIPVWIDSIEFNGVTRFTVARWRHPSNSAGLLFPIRSFTKLDQLPESDDHSRPKTRK